MKKNPKSAPFAGKNVLVLDCYTIQALPMLKAFSELGCVVTAAGMTRFDVGVVSRYADRRALIPVKAFEEEEYIARLTEVLKERRYDAVVPLTDSTARVLSKNKESLSRYANIAVDDWDVVRRIDDKLPAMLVCREHGIPSPKTYSVSDRLEDILEAVDSYPAAMKPRIGCGGEGFRKIESAEELARYYPAAVEKFGPMLVEEYIPQTGTQFQCEIYVGRDGKVKSAIIYDKPRWYPVTGGSSCCNVTVDRPEQIAHCVELLEKLGWHGYADLDLIEDPRDGSVRIMEINPRITGSVKIAFLAGIDFARQILEDALGLPVTVYSDYRKNVVIRRFPVDCLWFVKSPRRFRTKPCWFSPCFHDQVFSWTDPLPTLAYLLKPLIRRVFRRKFRRGSRVGVGESDT